MWSSSSFWTYAVAVPRFRYDQFWGALALKKNTQQQKQKQKQNIVLPVFCRVPNDYGVHPCNDLSVYGLSVFFAYPSGASSFSIESRCCFLNFSGLIP